MFIEVCIFATALHSGSELYKKIKDQINQIKTEFSQATAISESPETNSSEESDKGKNLFVFASKFEANYQKFIQEKIDPLFGGERDRQLKEISVTEELSEEDKDANRRLGVTAGNISLALVCRAIYPPLIILSLPGLLWITSVYFKDAYHSLFREHRITMSVLNSILVTLSILSGYLFAGVLSNFLFSLSRKFSARTKDNSRKKLVNVFGRQSATVWIQVNGTEIEIPFEQLQTGDVVIVNPGEMIPADGVIINGTASVDQRALTGESQPAEKETGDQVFASSLVLSGRIYIRAEQAGQETVAAKIGNILSQTIEYKTSFESKAEKMADRSVSPTLCISALALLTGGASSALAILVSSVGHNMQVIAPLSTLNFLRIASQEGILIKDGSALEGLRYVDTIIFDKTGTLTMEQPRVGNIYSLNGFSEDALLTYAAAAEYRQIHPAARAILAAASDRNLEIPNIEESRYEIGYGISVLLDERIIRIGSGRFIETEGISIPPEIKAIQEECGIRGYSLIMMAIDKELEGVIELRPAIRPEAKQLIQHLRDRGISTYIISGDQEEPTQALSQELGIDHYFANTLPEQKAEIIEQLRQDGKNICFVGDGINDSIALKKANVSVSLRGAATAATDTAQIVLMDENLMHLTALLDIAKKFEKNQKRNLMITIIPGLLCAGGVFLLNFGIYTSLVMYFAGLGVGIVNSVSPLIEQKKIEYRSVESE
jgi:Cu2+-exporting ATPase